MLQLLTVLIWTALLYLVARTWVAVSPGSFRAFLAKVRLGP